ncbi:hypothetical protein Tco_0503877 [Tanacetum coccineum]
MSYTIRHTSSITSHQRYFLGTKTCNVIHVSDKQGARLQGITVSVEQVSKDFPFGSAINNNIIGNLPYQVHHFAAIQVDTRRILKGSFVLCIGEPPEKGHEYVQRKERLPYATNRFGCPKQTNREPSVSSTVERTPITRPLPTTYLVPPMESYKSYNGGTDEEFMEDDFKYYMEELWELLEIMGEFNADQQCACSFLTGAPLLPPDALAVNNAPTNVAGVSEAADDDLPSVMTCANYLKLPAYSTKEKPVTQMTPIVEATDDLTLLLEASNKAWCRKGTRIIMGWNHNDVDVVVLTQDDPVIHTRVWLKMERKEIFCSFVLISLIVQPTAFLFWRNLSKHKVYIHGRPWCILGDFNAALFMDDSTASGSNVDIAMREFRDCIEDIEVLDVQCTGLQYTWNQKPKGMNGMLKKLDRVMANIEFNDHFVGAHAIFKPYRISDHSPSVLCIPTLSRVKPRPFKFFNILTTHEKFLDVVKGNWEQQVSGFHMYRVVKKLKNMKKPFWKLLYDKGNLHANVSRVRAELDSIQTLLDADPFNAILREREASCVVEFNEAVLLEERFLKQKAKIQWLKEGDSNSAYFHKAVKSRTSRSRIDAVTNSEGVVFENDMVPNAFVAHYESFLGLAGETHGFNVINLFNSCLNEQEANDMVRNVTAQEVKEAFFSIGDDKSPGPDGYTAAFFKEAWNVVANDVTNAICEFFRNGTLLKELNHTIIALIPKVKNPTRVVDYRPISCCNVLFKCISKIIANRIKHSLMTLISPNQFAFIPGRSITD